MAIHQNDRFIHWNYYVALEQDLAQVSRFIEFDRDNFDTFSIELVHLILASSSEVDVVLKALCNLKNPNVNHENINNYRDTVKSLIPDLITEECTIPRFGLNLHPWDNWNNNPIENPEWWKDYNSVKHERNSNFKKANLKNTLNSMAALALVILYYYREVFARQSIDDRFKNVTSTLEAGSTLIKFNDNYYFDNVVV